MIFDSMITISLTIATVGAGLMAGVYFAFSGFIMRSLDQLGAVRAADAMNAINQVILRSWFMPLFFGSSLLYAVLAGVALFSTDLAGRWLLFAAAMVYVVGMFMCTALFNVPLNEQLASAGSGDKAKDETWAHYIRYWTRWNHLRSVCSLVSMVLSIQYLVRYT